MNTINQLSCQYITPNKTVETLLVPGKKVSRTVYVYNYKGTSFRLFFSKQQLDGFFKNMNDGDIHFDTEEELDNYLAHVS